MTQDQLKQLLESRALDDTVDKINKRLKDDHGMASRILRMIDTGYFNKQEAIEEGKLPQSCNKFRLENSLAFKRCKVKISKITCIDWRQLGDAKRPT